MATGENLRLTRWEAGPEEGPAAFALDRGRPAAEMVERDVVVPRDGEARIAELLNAGARSVAVGEAALNDDALVGRLQERFGGERLGLWLPVGRFANEWQLDTQSNADFSFYMPTHPVPRWEIINAAGEGTGTDAMWWTLTMAERGAGWALLSVSDPADEDLAICADLRDRLGWEPWLSWPNPDVQELRFWAVYAGVRNFALPAGSDIEEVHRDLVARLEEEAS